MALTIRKQAHNVQVEINGRGGDTLSNTPYSSWNGTSRSSIIVYWKSSISGAPVMHDMRCTSPKRVSFEFCKLGFGKIGVEHHTACYRSNVDLTSVTIFEQSVFAIGITQTSKLERMYKLRNAYHDHDKNECQKKFAFQT